MTPHTQKLNQIKDHDKSGRGYAGAAASALASKERARKAVEKYNHNPNLCKACKKDILVRPGERLYEVLLKKFCNQSCAARSNKNSSSKVKPKKKCLHCGEEVKCNSRKTCSRRCAMSVKGNVELVGRDKQDLFKSRSGWQSARSSIQRHARKTYRLSGKAMQCFCGYSNHVEIAHIVSVSSFSDDALITDINSIDNLIALCPNHHWEFDAGMLVLSGGRVDVAPRNAHNVEIARFNSLARNQFGLIGESDRPRYTVTVETTGLNPVRPAKINLTRQGNIGTFITDMKTSTTTRFGLTPAQPQGNHAIRCGRSSLDK